MVCSSLPFQMVFRIAAQVFLFTKQCLGLFKSVSAFYSFLAIENDFPARIISFLCCEKCLNFAKTQLNLSHYANATRLGWLTVKDTSGMMVV